MASPRQVTFSKEQIEIMEKIMHTLDGLVDICKALVLELSQKETASPGEIALIDIIEEVYLLEKLLDEAPGVNDEPTPKIII